MKLLLYRCITFITQLNTTSNFCHQALANAEINIFFIRYNWAPEDSCCLRRVISSAEHVRRYTSNMFVTKHTTQQHGKCDIMRVSIDHQNIMYNYKINCQSVSNVNTPVSCSRFSNSVVQRTSTGGAWMSSLSANWSDSAVPNAESAE